MWTGLINDFIWGLTTSLRFDVLLKVLYQKNSMYIAKKILITNLFLAIIPGLVFDLIKYFNLTVHSYVELILRYPIQILSTIVHSIYYMDLINEVSTYKKSQVDPRIQIKGTLITVSVTLTMIFYQLIVGFTTFVIQFLLSKVSWLAYIINFAILIFYHSLYCYNNLWNHHKIKIFFRINMHEELWPYYFGYGLIGSCLYLMNNIYYIMAVYNVYMMVVIALPFLIEPPSPRTLNSYPKLDLSIFARLLEKIFYLIRLCTF